MTEEHIDFSVIIRNFRQPVSGHYRRRSYLEKSRDRILVQL